MAKATKTEKGLAKRVSAVERKVDALTREAPPRPEDVIARQSMEQQYADQMARLQGSRTSALTPDDIRGAASGLGFGTGSRRRK
jgi:hypothetical protein